MLLKKRENLEEANDLCNEARRLLEEANDLCDADSYSYSAPDYYKFYKVDVNIALAKIYSLKDKRKAIKSAKLAKQISEEIHYKKGQDESLSLRIQ